MAPVVFYILGLVVYLCFIGVLVSLEVLPDIGEYDESITSVLLLLCPVWFVVVPTAIFSLVARELFFFGIYVGSFLKGLFNGNN